MWNERYSSAEYAYGKSPNQFLEGHFQHIPMGKVLSLAEGEGRNAVFLAKQGYEVTAVDGSEVGLEKARKLADEHGVGIACIHADLAEFEIGEEQWDGIVIIFCPMLPALREQLMPKVVAGLKRGGVLLIEVYTPEQLKHGTGGGDKPETMLSREILSRSLAGLEFVHLEELEREIFEGSYHTGLSAVVQAIARKPT